MTSTAMPTSSNQLLDDRFVQLSSSSLAENLLVSFPHSSGEIVEPDPHLLERWIQQIAVEIRRRQSLVGQRMEGNVEETLSEATLLKKIRDEGLQRWKQQHSSSLPDISKNKSSSAKSSQVSLFLSQFNAGGALSSFMSWERIEEESQGDDDVKLQMLQKVQHVQDLVPDWEQYLRPYFLEGLRSLTRAKDFVELHRQWFDKSRSSSEFRTLQIALCQNLVTVIEEQSKAIASEGRTGDISSLKSMVDLALDMFEDWMLRGLYVQDPRVFTLGRTLWGWLLVVGSEVSFTPAAQCMIEVDGQAAWFSSWVAHLSPDQCLELCADGSEILPKVLSKCHTYIHQQNGSTHDYTVCSFWLTILHSILLTTRVARFPWERVMQSNTTAADSKLFVLDLYLGFLKKKQYSCSHKSRMCADAIETICWGCLVEKELLTTMTAKVNEAVEQCDNKNDHKLLETILTRLHRELRKSCPF